MEKVYKDILKQFQCEYNRLVEENFASTLSEMDNIRLFFINENRAFTDGKNIVVDPAYDHMFVDFEAMIKTEKFLKLDHIISSDPYLALKMVTRAQTIHEALHLIYSDFPIIFPDHLNLNRKIELMLIGFISNIIEDSFIESAGASVYDNMNLYLMWGRVSRLFSSTPSVGTLQRHFDEGKIVTDENLAKSEEELENIKKVKLISEILDYFTTKLLYPMCVETKVTEGALEYINKCDHLFLNASICGNSKERMRYSGEIYEILSPLIPSDDNALEGFSSYFEELTGGNKTHSSDSISINQVKTRGKEVQITRRLFVIPESSNISNENNNLRYSETISGEMANFDNLNEQHIYIVKEFTDQKNAALSILNVKGIITQYIGGDFDASAIHKNIIIKVNRPKPNINLKRAYQNIYNKYQININFYNSKFKQLLSGNVETKENKFIFGNSINSKMLFDVKKRYWTRNVMGMEVPDVAILFMIDGSGSMDGMMQQSAMHSLVILHEVLEKNGIKHAIVEHRAIYNENVLNHNILLDFNYKINEKFNILALKADEGTREGLSLFWAQKYLNDAVSAEYKVIIMISDGVPAHAVSENDIYFPPVSIKDTANAVRKIQKAGIDIIAVALDSPMENSCYNSLKQMYNNVIACDNLKQLTGKLLEIVSKLLKN